MANKEEQFLRENVLCREFGAQLPDGTIARLAFTLSGNNSETVVTVVARRAKATAHGLAFILEHPSTSPRTLGWVKVEGGLMLCVPKDEGDLEADLQELVFALAERFLAEIAWSLPASRPEERQASPLEATSSFPATTSTLGDIQPTPDAPSILLWRTS